MPACSVIRKDSVKTITTSFADYIYENVGGLPYNDFPLLKIATYFDVASVCEVGFMVCVVF